MAAGINPLQLGGHGGLCPGGYARTTAEEKMKIYRKPFHNLHKTHDNLQKTKEKLKKTNANL